mmetsp:Transcript_53864/g.161169  ORF Transcript_53864/g.161169 Transcript_53864/m.161169 type:complete len:84 (-) Transcript_53864:3965-4216(-)
MPSAPEFKFEFTPEATVFNSALVSKHGHDLTRSITSHQGTIISYGYDFCPVAMLDTLLQHHPNWFHIRNNLKLGVRYKSTRLP